MQSSPAAVDSSAAGLLCAALETGAATTVAIVGLCKNAGKTTVVNTLLARCSRPLGLTSLGLDGEDIDSFTGLAKPRIVPPRGTVVATTRGSLKRSAADLEVVDELPFRTPLGPVVVGRAPGCMPIEVSGPTTIAALRETVERMRRAGASLVLVDGALDRLGSASPAVADGVIVATGAAAGDDLDEAVSTTRHTLDLLTLPAADDDTRRIVERWRHEGARLVCTDAQGRCTPLDLPTAVGEGAAVARQVRRDGTTMIYVGGAVTRDFVEDLARLLPPGKRLRIVVRNATVLIMSPSVPARLRRRGIVLEVLDPLTVLAVTTNPFRLPRPVDARLFFAAVAETVPGRVPVVDVVGDLVRPVTDRTADAGPHFDPDLDGDP